MSPRRAEPISKRTAKNGTVSYEFRADVGTRPDGSRDSRRFTFRTLAEARKELRRITSEVAAGTYNRPTAITVDEACDAWLAGQRGIRRVTLEGYRNDLNPVRRYLGGRKPQQLTKADGDALVEWMLTAGRRSPKHFQPDSLAGRVAAMVGEHPDGISASELAAAFPGQDVHTCLSGLIRAGRVTRPRRAVYVLAEQAGADDDTAGGVTAVSMRSTLTRFSAVVRSFVDQGVLPCNVIALVKPPKTKRTLPNSWTLAEVQAFRESVRDERLAACGLLSTYGLRRSEVLGLRWSDISGDMLRIRQSRVAVGAGSEVGETKSTRGDRDLPLPADVTEALKALRQRQRTEALAAGVGWSDDRLVAVREDGEPLRPECYSDEFHRLRERAGLPRIRLHGLRNTSVTLMLDQGIPLHIVAGWHGHTPAIALGTYADAKTAELRAAGASLFD